MPSGCVSFTARLRQHRRLNLRLLVQRVHGQHGCEMRLPRTSVVRCFSTSNDVPESAKDAEIGSVPSASKKTKARLLSSKKFSLPKAYLDLGKAKLSALVVTTTAAGFVAAGGPISTQLDVLASAVVGTALCSCSAAAWNQILERHRDSKMKRTQQRPLVSGALTVPQATTAAALWGLLGTSLLAAGTDPVTTALGASNIVLYAGVYTHLKPISITNTWVGAVVGAIPPVMGWTAATGGSLLDFEALWLGTTLYLWQMPHFFALSYMHRVDYQRGGFAMVPCLEEDGQKTASLIVRYAWYLSTLPIVAAATELTSSMFALEGIALNAYALSVAHRFQRERTNANARRVFLTSLWYLPSFLMLFLLHSKVWDTEKGKDDDAIRRFLADGIHYLRQQGREMCVHETAVTRVPDGQDACPVTIGAKQSKKAVKVATQTALEQTQSTTAAPEGQS